MKLIIALVLCTTVTFAQQGLTELGLTFPIKTSTLSDYVKANGVTSNPLTSGYSNGVEIGRHLLISPQATVGVLANLNMFLASDSTFINQIYQLDVFCVGRLYFGQSWHGGLFLEVASGPEISAAKFHGAALLYQINIGSRIGAGYNYKFSNDVTVGAAIYVSPSLTMGDIMNGTKVAVSMLW